MLAGEVAGQILAATVTPPPESLRAAGVRTGRAGGWRTGRARVRASASATTRSRSRGASPAWPRHRTEGFKFSAGPQLEAKVRGVAGLYLAPPQDAVAVCADEKPQIQAPDRTQPVLPMRPGIPGRHTRDYLRHGTTALSAALEAAAGTVTGACYPRRRYGEFPRFLTKAAAACPRCELRVACGNYATHKHADVRARLARPENQRITLHFVPASCSWPNLIECFFSVITRPAIRRGSSAPASELISAIAAFTDHWNEHPRPFTWTKNAGEILASIQRARTKQTHLHTTRELSSIDVCWRLSFGPPATLLTGVGHSRGDSGGYDP